MLRLLKSEWLAHLISNLEATILENAESYTEVFHRIHETLLGKQTSQVPSLMMAARIITYLLAAAPVVPHVWSSPTHGVLQPFPPMGEFK